MSQNRKLDETDLTEWLLTTRKLMQGSALFSNVKVLISRGWAFAAGLALVAATGGITAFFAIVFAVTVTITMELDNLAKFLS